MRLNSKLVTPFARVASLGYSIPGAVAAVGILGPLVWIDNSIDNIFNTFFGYSTGLILTGTWIALLFAYLVRFLALAMQSVENALIKIPQSIDFAARSLGLGPRKVLINIHFRLIWGGLTSGFIIIFVDVLKELPMTLLLRPFNFETLATYVYQYASDEMLEESSLAALMIVIAGIGPVILLNSMIKRSGKTKEKESFLF